VALTSAPARARLIIYDKFGAVGELNADVSNPLISPGISDGDRIHLVVHVDTKAANVCRQPGKGLYPLPFAAMELNRTQFELFGGFVEVNNAAGGCSTPGDDQTGVARLLIGPVDMTLFGLGQVGESVPSPLFSPDRVDGYLDWRFLTQTLSSRPSVSGRSCRRLPRCSSWPVDWQPRGTVDAVAIRR
jgi:hypothetical protein